MSTNRCRTRASNREHYIYENQLQAEQQKSWVTTLDQALKNAQAPEWQWDRLDIKKHKTTPVSTNGGR